MSCRNLSEWAWEIHERTLRRSLSGSRHLLRTPGAIAFDAAHYDALRAEFDRLEVTDRETGDLYAVSATTFDAHRFPFDRGHGPQYALTLSWWSKNGSLPVRHRGPLPIPSPAQIAMVW